jgi:hypothetical protein
VKDVEGDGQSKKESETSKKKGRGVDVELLIDRAQSTRREKWEIKAAKRGTRKQRPRIQYLLGASQGRC